MNFYLKKLKEKQDYKHIRPKDKSLQTKKVKDFNKKHPIKNSKLGMFP